LRLFGISLIFFEKISKKWLKMAIFWPFSAILDHFSVFFTYFSMKFGSFGTYGAENMKNYQIFVQKLIWSQVLP